MIEKIEAAEIQIVQLRKDLWAWLYVAILPLRNKELRFYIRILHWWRMCLDKGAA